MRIMYLLFSFTVGGTETLVRDICNEMSESDNDIFLYIINKVYDEDMLKTLSPNVDVFLLNREAGANDKIQLLFKVAQFIRDNKIDVVHCNSLDAPEILLFSKFFRRKVKIVYTVHGMGQYCTLNKVRIIYRNLICDSIIAISESVRNDIIKCGASKKKTTVIYNAINTEKFIKKQDKIFEKENIVIGNVARIDPKIKGQDILINAIDKIKNKYRLTCLMAGDADANHQEDLNSLKRIVCENFENSKTEIVFLGTVHDIPTFLEKIDIFVLPSRSEGFGISLIEAMAMGIPCVACDLYGPAEIIGKDERGLLFEVGNVDDLAIKLQMMIKNYDKELEKAKKNQDFVKETFNIKLMCEKLAGVYIK